MPSLTLTEQKQFRKGVVLVFLAAILWSLGGAIGRYIETADSWRIVFWRCLFASGFLLLFMLGRYGVNSTQARFKKMGVPGLAVAICFATATIAFVIALPHTSVANIVLFLAAVPLIAALLGFIVFREHINASTWLAISLVLVGMGIMIADSIQGKVSALGDGLALTMALVFSCATLITRHYAQVSMVPAAFLGTLIATCIGWFFSQGIVVSLPDMLFLFLFGVLNLGLGMACFVSGTRLIPATLAALLSTAEPVLAPLWVGWLHQEVPLIHTIVGGSVVLVALLFDVFWKYWHTYSAPH